MLKASIVNAVNAAVAALSDIAIEVVHVERATASYTPGSAPSYPEILHDVKAVITTYSMKDIISAMDRISASDRQAIILPIAGALTPVPKVNDLIRDGATDYRIMQCDHVTVGDVVMMSTAHIRPV